MRDLLREEGHTLGTSPIAALLKAEGFSQLPRRGDDASMEAPRPLPADAAKVQRLNLKPRMLRTTCGGLGLFLPRLATSPLEDILNTADFPGAKQRPADDARRSLLARTLFGHARHRQVMRAVCDEGLALWAGLTVMPTRALLTAYRWRVAPSASPNLMQLWCAEVGKLGRARGGSCHLDCHTRPLHGEDALLEKHDIAQRARRQKGLLAFIAHEEEHQVFCSTTAALRQDEQHDEVLRFVAFWQEKTGKVPEAWIFDARLTTYANLDTLNEMHMQCMTLRRSTTKRLHALHALPLSAWRRIALDKIARASKTPRIDAQEIALKGYAKPIRQMAIKDLGHAEPTILLPNPLATSPVKLMGRYAKRMRVENGISEARECLQMDALSSAVAMQVHGDLLLTMMASRLYRLLGASIGRGYEPARSHHIFRDVVDATATIDLTEKEVMVKFQQRAHNPRLLAAGFDKACLPIPWLANRTLRLVFG